MPKYLICNHLSSFLGLWTMSIKSMEHSLHHYPCKVFPFMSVCLSLVIENFPLIRPALSDEPQSEYCSSGGESAEGGR